jgi:hypothetical protein
LFSSDLHIHNYQKFYKSSREFFAIKNAPEGAPLLLFKIS